MFESRRRSPDFNSEQQPKSPEEERAFTGEWQRALKTIRETAYILSIDELYKVVVSVLPTNLQEQQSIPEKEPSREEKIKLLRTWASGFNMKEHLGGLTSSTGVAQSEFQGALTGQLDAILEIDLIKAKHGSK